jgi:excisionase family DNA binding protein
MASALTVKQVAERYGVTQHTVLAWIQSGEMGAVSVSRSPNGRPRWRITPEAMQRWESSRIKTPTTRTRRRRTSTDVIEFY